MGYNLSHGEIYNTNFTDCSDTKKDENVRIVVCVVCFCELKRVENYSPF